MAYRPVFTADENKGVQVVSTEFDYFNGFAKIQRQRSVKSLHAAFLRKHPEKRILEISSFSEEPLGIALSAFNLKITLDRGEKVPVENAYQAGKVFALGGPYEDLLFVTPAQSKKDERLKNSGRITGFMFQGKEIPTYPSRLFYTWLYLKALTENETLAQELMQYDAFTDIVYNPDKSVSCQAFAAAMYVFLEKKGEAVKAANNPAYLASLM